MHKARDFGRRKWSIAVPLGLLWRSQETTLRKNFKIRQYLPISAVKPLRTTYYKPDRPTQEKNEKHNLL